MADVFAFGAWAVSLMGSKGPAELRRVGVASSALARPYVVVIRVHRSNKAAALLIPLAPNRV